MHYRLMDDLKAYLLLVVLAGGILLWGCKEESFYHSQGWVDARVQLMCDEIGSVPGFSEWGAYGSAMQKRGDIRVILDKQMQARVERGDMKWLDGLGFWDEKVIWLSETIWDRRDHDRCLMILLHEIAHVKLNTLDEARCDEVVARWRAARVQ